MASQFFFLLHLNFFSIVLAPKGGTVRILLLFEGAKEPIKEELPWCHLWYKDQLGPVQSKVLRAGEFVVVFNLCY